MTMTLPPLRLTGATVLRDARLVPEAVGLAEGVLTDAALPEVDLTGYLVLPGIVDLHGDGFERHIAPRPSAPMPLAFGLRAAEREAAAHGLTTAWFAQSWSWEGGLRGPDHAERVMGALAAHRAEAVLDLRLQIRCETHLFDEDDRLLAAIGRYGVDYVVFNNHLPEAIGLAEAGSPALTTWAERDHCTPEAFRKRLFEALARTRAVPRRLLTLARAFDALGLRYGSHDDADGATRDYFHALGARIAEFPQSRGAASVARVLGDPVLMGAPNVVRGGSQAGHVAARDLLAEGLVDALVSDYHVPCLPAAAWALAESGLMPFARAWGLISTRPARIMGLVDRGTLAPGQRADLVIVNPRTRAIEATIAGGRLAYLAGEAGARLLARTPGLRFAAE